MDEPDRLSKRPGSLLEQALLQEGRRYQGPDDLRAHTLAALGLAVTAGAASSGVLAWLLAKTGTTKLVLTLSTLTLLTAIPVSYVLVHNRTKTPPSVPAPARTPQAEHGPAAGPAPAAAVEAPPSRLAAAPATAALPAPARAAAAATSSALRAELAALDAVRSTLANDDAGGALSFLGAYFRTFPHGRLRLEAEVLRIDALAKSGRPDLAKRHAKEFIRRYPNSVLTARVEPYALR